MTEKKKRRAPISYRPPEILRKELLARIEKSGLSVNAFITQAIFGNLPPRQSRRPSVATQDLARLLAEAAKLRGQLETLPVDGERQVQLHEQAMAVLTDIRTLLMQALGRER
ncbi:hypothetical protein WGT02_03770 [Rhizobium sp. T1470]|uniref:hypothetical protein n=1 Tax=unclassified Rhizobium TaxID=2613769 RepID=UPI001AAE62F4|nr:hypothetical protein [Rhizobium sp. T1473]MCA0800439.1 hypothetical protein [Rhizobium sp. T1473]